MHIGNGGDIRSARRRSRVRQIEKGDRTPHRLAATPRTPPLDASLDGQGNASNIIDFKVFREICALATSLEAWLAGRNNPPATAKPSLHPTSTYCADAVFEFTGRREVLKPTPIGRFSRFLRRANFLFGLL